LLEKHFLFNLPWLFTRAFIIYFFQLLYHKLSGRPYEKILFVKHLMNLAKFDEYCWITWRIVFEPWNFSFSYITYHFFCVYFYYLCRDVQKTIVLYFQQLKRGKVISLKFEPKIKLSVYKPHDQQLDSFQR